MKIAYKGFDRGGKAVHGVVDAGDSREAAEALRKQGVIATDLTAASATDLDAPVLNSKKRVLLGGGKRLDSVVFMCRQLSLLVATGTPLVDAIQSLEAQSPKGEWRSVLASLREKLEEGKSLAEAMGAHPEYFDAVCRSMVAAGESGGKLDVMLDRLGVLLRQQSRIRKTVSHAMIYPMLLVFVALGVMIAMVGFVLPRFEGLFKSLDTELPAMTKVLMQISHFLRAYWPYITVGVIGTVVGGFFYFRSALGKRMIDTLSLRIPKLGTFTRVYATARIIRVLATLLEGKVPLLDALSLAKHSVPNTYYISLMRRAEEAVLRGESLSQGLSDPTLVPPAVLEAVKSGERSGRLADVLGSVAEYMDEDTQTTIKTVTGLLEPLILLVLGVIVGSMAISMMMPLFDLTAAGGVK
ncbi:type II secretion system protein F [Phycisphaerae bacterium]|jgi:type II secretory pathway component PulF|nr:type II secretion system protein F [Phycisphaerae bacterium]